MEMVLIISRQILVMFIYMFIGYILFPQKADHSGGQVFGESSAVCDPAVRYFGNLLICPGALKNRRCCWCLFVHWGTDRPGSGWQCQPLFLEREPLNNLGLHFLTQDLWGFL